METLLFYLPYYLVALSGMLLHVLKKKVRGEAFVDIKNYVKAHLKSNLIAIGATTLGFVYLVSSGLVNFEMCIVTGYAFDSLFNKWDASSKK